MTKRALLGLIAAHLCLTVACGRQPNETSQQTSGAQSSALHPQRPQARPAVLAAKKPTAEAAVTTSDAWRTRAMSDRSGFEFKRVRGGFEASFKNYRATADTRGNASLKLKGSEFRFHTDSITRAGAELRPDTRQVGQLSRSGSVQLGQGDLTEELQGSKRGLQQSWRFARKPTGEGALTIRVASSGADYVRTTKGGLVFRTSSGQEVAYSHATWLDADGRNTSVAAQYVEGAIELEVPAAVIASSAYPAVLDPWVGTPFDVDRTTGVDFYADVAGNEESGYVVVHVDASEGRSATLRATRIRVDARSGDYGIADEPGIAIQSSDTSIANPVIAHQTGTNYFLIAWQEQTATPAAVIQTIGVAVLDYSTGALTSRPIFIGPTADRTNPAVAYDRGFGSFLVVYESGRTVLGTSVVLNAEGVPGAIRYNTIGEGNRPDVAGSDSLFYVAYEMEILLGAGSLTSVIGQPVTIATIPRTTGTAIGVKGSLPNNAYQPAVTYSRSSGFIVSFTYAFSETDQDIYATRVATDGTASEPVGIDTSGAVESESDVAVSRDESSALFVYRKGSSPIYTTWRSPTDLAYIAGPILASTSAEVSDTEPHASSAGTGEYMIAYGHPEAEAFAALAVGLPNGSSCGRETAMCLSGMCVDGVCCDSVCGGGAGNDCQACNGVGTATPAGVCGVVTAGTVCRGGSGDSCDPVEQCDGRNLECPADNIALEGTVCRGSRGTCDAAETCTGSPGRACPADGFATAGTECRGSSGVCDLAEACTGSSASCPADRFASSATTCRGSSGVCDVAETCSGTAAACPADRFASAATTCRGASGACDVAETCSGAAATCPADRFASATTTCRASGGVCDVAETCSGAAAACPADRFASATTTCRPSAGVCDVAESCGGTAATCPPDRFASATTECRSSAGPCDIAETCSGATASCAPDRLAAAGVVCRSGGDVCNPAEACNGVATACPVDDRRRDGTSCDDGLVCNGANTCSGGSCSMGAALSCDDRNLCTADACAEPGGCRSVVIAGCCNVDTNCDDGDICTEDSCSAPGGRCETPVRIPGCCTTNSDCNDGSTCTTDSCNLTTNRCEAAPIAGCCGSDADCGDDNTCTADRCDVATGMCSRTDIADCCNVDSECDDGNDCSEDSCESHVCGSTPIAECCQTASDCDDGNTCTADSCNEGTCVAADVEGCCETAEDCDDGDTCTTDSCNDGICETAEVPSCCESAADCDDGNTCTTDSCVDNACDNEGIPGCTVADGGNVVGGMGGLVDSEDANAGCMCSAPGAKRDERSYGWLGLLGLGLIAARRRARKNRSGQN